MNRRHFLISAGATGLVAATGVTAFALTRTPTAALAPGRKQPRRSRIPAASS